MTTLQQTRYPDYLRYLRRSLALTQVILLSSIRNIKGVAISLFTPMLLLIIFTLTSDSETPSMVPFVVGLSIMLSGQLLAQMLVTWRQQKIFQRMAVTPVPMGGLVLGVILAWWVQFFLQTLLVLIAALFLNSLSLSIIQIIGICAAMAIGIFPFLAAGAFIATLTDKPDIASNAYIFILLPMIFLGGSIFEIPVFGSIGQYLPPTLFINLLNGLFGFGTSSDALLQVAGLLLYAIGFTIVVSKRFRWD